MVLPLYKAQFTRDCVTTVNIFLWRDPMNPAQHVVKLENGWENHVGCVIRSLLTGSCCVGGGGGLSRVYPTLIQNHHDLRSHPY